MAGMAWNEERGEYQKQTGNQKAKGESDERDENAEIAVGKAHLEA